MNIFSASYRKSIRIVAATTLVMGCTFGTVALVSGTSSPAEAKKKAVKQEPKKKAATPVHVAEEVGASLGSDLERA